MLRPVLLLALVATACAPQAAPEAPPEAVLPTFAPVEELTADTEGPSPTATAPTSPDAAPTTTATSRPVPTEGLPTASDGPRPVPPGTEPTALSGTITDRGDDVRPGTPLQDPPPAVDLRRLLLDRSGDGYEVRVELGGPAPERREGDRITNVATFYDVDGDGELDYQVYATSTPDGWGSAYFDHVADESAYADDDGVDVTVEDGVLVIRFPSGHLGGATDLQWSAATQWGTFEELQTGAEARDRAPDDGRGVRWPSAG